MSARAAGRAARLALAAILGIIWACGVPTAAHAHAIILESSPAAGTAGPAPKRLVLRFNSRLEKALCSVQLVGPRQRSIALMHLEPDAPPARLQQPDRRSGEARVGVGGERVREQDHVAAPIFIGSHQHIVVGVLQIGLIAPAGTRIDERHGGSQLLPVPERARHD